MFRGMARPSGPVSPKVEGAWRFGRRRWGKTSICIGRPDVEDGAHATVREAKKHLEIRRRFFFRIARDPTEYRRQIAPADELTRALIDEGIDLFTFLERRWCSPLRNPSDSWVRADDNIALLHVISYDQWWENVGKKTRNMVRKAEKSGIGIKVAEPNEALAKGIWKIYNETPFRQGRWFPHYGISLNAVQGILSSGDAAFIGGYYGPELVGFIRLEYGEEITIVSQILSLQQHWDKGVNNALLAKAVEVCAREQRPWIMYGRMGNHPSLDTFKANNGFVKYPLTRYYVPLTTKGGIATAIGLHRDPKDVLPPSLKYLLIPVFDWLSRARVRLLGLAQRPKP